MTASEFTSALLGKYIIISKHPHSCSWHDWLSCVRLASYYRKKLWGFNRCMFLLCVLFSIDD